MHRMAMPGHRAAEPCQTRVTWAVILIVVCGNSQSWSAEPVEYQRDILPILRENCFACHGADRAARKAKLRLDHRAAAIEAGAFRVDKPDDSELLTRIFSEEPEEIMPPPKSKKTLTPAQKQRLAQWIRAGAPYDQHWSLVVPRKSPLPDVQRAGWVKNAIDRFVLARLEAADLEPAPPVDAHRLFRRLHLDITGLPPSIQDLAAFTREYRDQDDKVLAAWIDRLMASSHWGEHRARYWLDAARYGDTHGLHFDNYREMWPYRDWVIRAFNQNQPFDRFTIEQLAGDLLPNPNVDQLIATGFQRCNITTNEGGTIDEENLANYAADRVQTLGWVYLGMTTNCCQCHDHKFDPISMRDYYSLAAYFRNTTQQAKDGNVKDGRGPVLKVATPADRPRWLALEAEIAATETQLADRKQAARDAYQKWLAAAQTATISKDIPTAQMLVHLPLNEGSGRKVVNQVGTPESFQAVGKVNWVPDGKLGAAPVIKKGSTFDLGALGDFEKNQPFSYGAWVRTAAARRTGGIIARMDVRDNYRGWDLWQNNDEFGVHLIQAWPGNAIKVVTSGKAVKPRQWQHVFVTYDGSATPAGVHIFVDGHERKLTVETNTIKPQASIRTKTPLRIGQRSQGQFFDGGAVQDVRIYSRSLSAGEVQALAGSAPIQTILATTAKDRTPQQRATLFNYFLATQDTEFARLSKQLARRQSERKAIDDRSPVTHIQTEKMKTQPLAYVLMRGQYDKKGEQVAAATPAVLHPLPAGKPNNRLGLAYWIVDAKNPLTTRVTVNRFWQQVFGQGIVVTPENLGITGAVPSHPELLDWLAVEFRESGWDVKHVFKLMLMSATYRQAALTTPVKLDKDRDNTLLSRGPRFRMDAEMVRDYALSASGLLSAKMYGPGTRPYQPGGIWDIVGLPGGDTRNYVQDKGENLYRRTIYHFWKRMAPPPNLEAFNAPSREVCTVRRERTNTPLQALVTLNDPQFVEAARHFAQSALTASGGDAEKTLDFIAHRALGRPLSAREKEIINGSKKNLADYYRSKTEDAKALVAVGESPVDNSLDVVELAAWTMICNQILNLDEVLSK